VLLALIAIGVLVVLGTRGSASSGKEKGHLVKQAAQGTLQAATLSVTRNEVTTNRPMPFLSGSTINAAQDALCEANGVANCDERAEAADSGTAADLGVGRPPAAVPPEGQQPAGQELVAGDPNRHTINAGPGTGHTYDAPSEEKSPVTPALFSWSSLRERSRSLESKRSGYGLR